MKLTIFKILVFSIIFSSCKKGTPSLGSDVLDWKATSKSTDFWDYSAFIQKYPESTLFDTALSSYFHVRDAAWEEDGMPIVDCFRNCADIRIMNDDNLLFENEKCKIESLRKLAFEFILNEEKDINKPETKSYKIPGTNQDGEMNIGIFWIHIMNEKQQNHNVQRVVSELVKGINDYKNHVEKQWYGTNPSETSKAVIDSLNANRLFFWGFDGEPFPTPPPMPENIDEITRIIEN